MISKLQHKLDAGEFVVTAEVCPPKGSDCAEFLAKAKALQGIADAINVTDNQGANMRISPLAAAALLVREGIEPIFQITCRDRNRMALQSDLLGAAALGVRNVLALTGDHISFGDHRQAKPVFDLDSVQLLGAIAELGRGRDLAGNPLCGAPTFFAGILLLKSARMARFITANIPGLRVPDHLVAELENAGDPLSAGVEIARRLAREAKPFCDGIHVMAMGREDLIPEIVKAVKST